MTSIFKIDTLVNFLCLHFNYNAVKLHVKFGLGKVSCSFLSHFLSIIEHPVIDTLKLTSELESEPKSGFKNV